MNTIKSITEEALNVKVVSVFSAGMGASGCVYCVEIKEKPYKLAIKVGDNYDLLREEKKMLEFLIDKVSFKVPKPYFICNKGDKSYLGLEFIEGKSGKKIPFFCNKKKLSDSVISAFMNMQEVKNNKFGKYDNPSFDSWSDYYLDFFNKVYNFSKEKYHKGELEEIVIKALDLISKRFDDIFCNKSDEAVLCHGDFWLPNLMFDYKTSELTGVLDPFDMLWAEKEYELFCLTAGADSKKLKLYENYKNKNATTPYCDLKLEIYALCNELHWYEILGTISHRYLIYRSKNVIKSMKIIQD